MATSCPEPAQNGALASDQRRQQNRETIFQPLSFRSGLVVKNRLFRSNISGRFDHYDGHGSEARLNWEKSFAEGGVGCIISSFTPITIRGRIMVNYATIDSDDKIPFWSRVARQVHSARCDAFSNDAIQSGPCKFIMQLSHSGRQQDVGGVENQYKKALSSTSQPDYFHGIQCQAMSPDEVERTVQDFADAARRAQDAGLDGVELHGANGYLITQFLSSAINDRTDKYGGSLEGRAQFVLEVIRAIKDKTGKSFHLQLKTNAADFDNALYPWRKRGNQLDDAIAICQWATQAGADAIHVSSGSIFPHPRNPPGDFPIEDARHWYDGMLSSGTRTRFNYFIFRSSILGPLFRWWWNHRRGLAYDRIKTGINLGFAERIRQALPSEIKVIVTGGFQHASIIADAIRSGRVDAVSIARPLVANRDLPKLFYAGMDWDDAAHTPIGQWPIKNQHPCSYCNRCLVNDLENPLGCYDLERYASHDQMIHEVMQVFRGLDNMLDNGAGQP